MSVARSVERLWRTESESWWRRFMLFPLVPLSWLFGAVGRRRVEAWRRPGRAARADATVISVGNLAVGGAGKTPVAIFLARWLAARGEKVVVLSRGYGREGKGPRVVSDGAARHTSVHEAGDEPTLIADACPGVAVMVGADRADLAVEATRRFRPSAIVLDDGFQHVRLHRALDLVVVDATNPFGNGRLMPRGPLRERPEALRRASAVWLTKVDQAEPEAVERLATRIEALTGEPPLRSALRTLGAFGLSGAATVSPASLEGKSVFLLAAVARPESFRQTLDSLGARRVGERLLRDHERFDARTLDRALAEAKAVRAEAIAVTEKDAVKLVPLLDGRPIDPPLVSVRVEAALRDEDLPRLETLLRRART